MERSHQTAIAHLERGLRACVREKFIVVNGCRSSTVMNLLHEAIYHAYAALLENHPQAAEVELHGEHLGKIALPYHDGAKNVDLGLKIRGTETFLDAIFVKSPVNNYSQNRKNYEESMTGTFVACRNAHRHLRIAFLDFLPIEDMYFDRKGVCTRKSTLKPPCLTQLSEYHPEYYAHARYGYHPELQSATTKSEFITTWERLESEGIEPLVHVDVYPILNVLIALTRDLANALMDAKDTRDTDFTALDRAMEMFARYFETGASTDTKEFGKIIGFVYGALGRYGAREYLHLYYFCREHWGAGERLNVHSGDVGRAWSLLDKELYALHCESCID